MCQKETRIFNRRGQENPHKDKDRMLYNDPFLSSNPASSCGMMLKTWYICRFIMQEQQESDSKQHEESELKEALKHLGWSKSNDHQPSKPRNAIAWNLIRKNLPTQKLKKPSSSFIMETSSSKAEAIKPVLLKAGIPLALSLAGFIYARIIAKGRMNSEASSIETPVSPHETDSIEVSRGEGGLNSVSSTSREDEEKFATSTQFMNLIRSSGIQDRIAYEDEILGLRTRIQELQKRESELERQFIRFCDLKEQESVLMELRNVLLLESFYVESLDREISSMEAENKRIENIVMEYLRVVEQLEHWKSHNGLLQRKAKRLLRKTKAQANIIREKDLKIQAKDAEIARNCEVLEGKSNVIKKLEDEVMELKSLTNQLQEQKHELSQKLELAENSHLSISKTEEEGMISIEDYKQLANEYEQVQKDRAAEVKELIYLRWCNACLRYVLKRYEILQDYIQENKDHMEQEFEGGGEIARFTIEQQFDDPAKALMEQGEPRLDVTTTAQVCSKRHKLLKKFKKWVEGSEKMKSKPDEKEKHENKCFGRHSVYDEEEREHFVHARKSCSSV